VGNVRDDRERKPSMSGTQKILALPRFAVGGFHNWSGAQKTVGELRDGSKPLEDISYLGLRMALEGLPAVALTDLTFPRNTARLACSAGPIADRLAARALAGAPTLQAALCTWLIPRHADQIQQTVDKGQIVVWVRLDDADDERRAYRALLAAGCGWVGVHDLI
jgi:hypothetical protein